MKVDSGQWNPDGGEAEWLRLVDFIEPGSEAVKKVIAQAKSKAPNGEFPAYECPPSWKGTVAELVNAQVKAIYETLREWGIGYAVEPWDSQPPAQAIRTHEEVLSSEEIGGPCLDLVVLMAACLEHVGIQPLLVVLEEKRKRRRHAVLGYRLEELRYGPETPANEMPSLLSERKLRELKNDGKVEFINCTGITRGENVDFEEALTQGRDYVESGDPSKRAKYKEHWNLVFALDVKVARHTALTREMRKYLEQVQRDALTLPPAFGFPPDVNFPDIRVRVQVRKGQRRYSEAEARAWETARREGYDEESTTKVYEQFPWTSLADKEREAERPLDWDREVRQRLKRAAILGDPGFGKTWLLKHEALKLAEEALKKLEQYPLATDKIKIPILLPLAQLAEQVDKKPIDEALLAALERRYLLGDRLKAWIGENLNSEKFVLLLDALDEVPPGQKEDFCEHLKGFAQKYDRIPILLTSRLVGYPGPPFPLPQDGEFELLPFDRRQQREFVRAWFAGRSEQGDRFLQKLRGNPQLYGLAGVPLLLALMCRLFDERDELPKSRADLYESCIWGILTRKWKTPRSEDDPRLHAKKRLVEELAYELFAAEKELFHLSELLELMKNLGIESPVELVTELQKDGLLIKAGTGDDPPFLFLHLTFQEYLTACALARRTKTMDFDGRQVPEWLAIVKPHLFDPRWEEVIRLLASKLEDATPLIQAIWNEPEDLFLGRLLLAGKCLVSAKHVQEKLRKKIIEEVFTLIVKASQRLVQLGASELNQTDLLTPPGLREIRQDFKRLLGALASAYGDIFRKLIAMIKADVGTFATLCRDEASGIQLVVSVTDSRVTEMTSLLVFSLGMTYSEEAVPYLIEWLELPYIDVVVAAAGALGKIGSKKAVPALLELLKSARSSEREAAEQALMEIGNEEAVPYLIKLLEEADLVIKESWEWQLKIGEGFDSEKAMAFVKGAAARALQGIVSEKAVPALLELLKSAHPSNKEIAARALGWIGSEEAIPHLLELLKASNVSVKKAAVEALGWIGSEKAILPLLDLLKNSALYPGASTVRKAAARALGKIGSKDVVPHLLELLKIPDLYTEPPIVWEVAQALGKIGGEEVVPHLIKLLGGPDRHVKMAAAWALGEISSEKAVLNLIELLNYPDDSVRNAAMVALGKIGSEAAVPTLIKLLQDPEPLVKKSAAEALGEIGSEAAVTALMKLLGELYLSNNDPEVQQEIAKALGKIGNEVAVPSLIKLLGLEALDEPYYPEVRQAAVEALRRIGSERAIQPLYELAQRSEECRWEALDALRAISRKQGIRILLDGRYIKVR